MPNDVAPLTLAPDLDPWERQPGETVKRHDQFAVYRDAGRGRTLRKTAETLTLNADYVRHVAAAHHWALRAEAWDLHRDRLHQAMWLDARREAAQHDSRLLDRAAQTVAARLADLDPADLTPGDLIRALDVVLRHRRALYGDPAMTVTVTSSAGGQVAAELAAFEAMTPEARSAHVVSVAEAVLRRAAARAGVLDDDD